jgi:hypothetical protein
MNKLKSSKIANIVNGIHVSYLSSIEFISTNVLNESTKMPIWNTPEYISGVGADAALILNPFKFEMGFVSTSVDITGLGRNFAMPPPSYPHIRNTVINIQNYYAGVTYIPFLLAYGFVYPSVGLAFYTTTYDYTGHQEIFLSVGAQADLTARWNMIFLSAGYRKYFINTESFDDQVKMQAGIRVKLN